MTTFLAKLWRQQGILLCLLSLSAHPCHGQTTPPSQMLDANQLKLAGVHFPPNLASLTELMRYQEELSTHQQLRVGWDSLPGREGHLRKEEVAGIPLAPNFVLLDRKRNLAGTPGKTDLLLSESRLVIVGTTSSDEARCIRVQGDQRSIHVENLKPGERHESADLIEPKVILYIYLSDDPLIKTVVFFKPRLKPDGGWRLQRVGAIDLVLKQSAKDSSVLP